jgi:hypothetical protein
MPDLTASTYAVRAYLSMADTAAGWLPPNRTFPTDPPAARRRLPRARGAFRSRPSRRATRPQIGSRAAVWA